MTKELSEDRQQRVAWQVRLITDVILKNHDDEILVEMLFAGFKQSFADGLQEAANFCDEIVKTSLDPNIKKVGSLFRDSIKELDKRKMRV